MAYWRMQLHPNDSGAALRHTASCLAAGFIGLDFGSGTGPTAPADDVQGQGAFRAFATDMKKGDIVLVVAHNFPFALCRVAGDYNYVRDIPHELGRAVWFRHFRRVDDVRYYGDLVTNPRDWQACVMVNTIALLRAEDTGSYALIQEWLSKATASRDCPCCVAGVSFERP